MDTLFAWPFLLALTNSPAQALEVELHTDLVLERMRLTYGIKDLEDQVGFRINGETRISGIESPFGMNYEFLSDGQFILDRLGQGMLESVEACGLETCVRLEGGVLRAVELSERAALQTRNLVLTGLWLSEQAPFDIRLERDDKKLGEIELSLRYHDEPFEARLVADRSSMLLRSLSYQYLYAPEILHMEDYQEVEGLLFPHRWRLEDGAGNEVRSVVSQVTPLASAPKKSFDLRVERPAVASFDATASVELRAERGKHGLLRVAAQLGQEEEVWWLLDTGAAGNLIFSGAPGTAALDTAGSLQVGGAAGTQQAQLRLGQSLRLGPLSLSHPLFVELAHPELQQALGANTAGILGLWAYGHGVIEMDVQRGRVRLHDPEAYELPGGDWQDVAFYDGCPCVEATFEGHEGWFRIDTGANANLHLHGLAVEELRLLKGRKTKRLKQGLAIGQGAKSKARIGNLEDFQLAGHSFAQPEVIFVVGEGGSMSDKTLLGTIGVGLLEPFVMVLDVPNDRIALVPREAWHP